ncbi:hypothetical protein [Streptomyces aurantiacus]|uniref:Uncharacterized protein n=1 Tax=Streptomyces aurantiacus TaxID=47760 RepID=A0A7G1P6N7_9ACTN|nr:hypothetical protein [Streptomyces aurantiacus]BCL30939.1 hypothetical protein GCM10017557_57980 [Streptomyces aurantiacus]
MTPPLWPLPPPFMWACGTCTALLDLLSEALLLADASPDSALYTQVALARHVVDGHWESVPAAHYGDCPMCDTYSSREGDPGGMWAEHRARSLFLPEAFARRL